MKKLIALLLVFALACTAPAPHAPPAQAPTPEPTVMASEQSQGAVTPPTYTSEPAADNMEEQETPVNAKLDIAPYTELGCEQVLTADQFANACHNDSSEFVVTYKVGTRNCLINVKSRSDARLTAGVTLTGFADGTAATTEFDRRLKVFNVGADKSVGERAYTFPKVDRATVNFVRNEYIIEVGSDTRICSEGDLLSVAKVVDQHIG